MKSSLLPFQSSSLALTIDADVTIVGQTLELKYILSGSIEQINLLNQALLTKERKNELWKDTCFEWFIGSNSKTQYWEFNASPNGDWNFYELEDYRKNLNESSLISAQDVSFSSQPLHSNEKNYWFEMRISLAKLFKNHPYLEADGALAITSVIRTSFGTTEYYSLKHPTEKPDFHNRTGFIISLKECE